jgi:hypothetical protein
MKPFEERWQACAARARQASHPDGSAPLGFATRVLAASQPPATPSVLLELAWHRLTWRCLALVGTALVICAAVEIPHVRDQKPLEPGIENTVAQLIWSL